MSKVCQRTIFTARCASKSWRTNAALLRQVFRLRRALLQSFTALLPRYILLFFAIIIMEFIELGVDWSLDLLQALSRSALQALAFEQKINGTPSVSFIPIVDKIWGKYSFLGQTIGSEPFPAARRPTCAHTKDNAEDENPCVRQEIPNKHERQTETSASRR